MSDFLSWLFIIGLFGVAVWLMPPRPVSRPAPPAMRPPVTPITAAPVPAPVAPARAAAVRPFSWSGASTARMTAELTASLCDGLTGEPLDPRQRLWRCTRCRTCYHEASRAALQAENLGRCLSCTATTFEPFSVAPSGSPVTLTARVWRVEAARDSGFYVAVLENKRWREARKLIFPPAFSTQPGARDFIESLAHRQVAVRGRLVSDGPLGPRIVVTDRSMVRATANPTPDRSR
ncbi:MAG: hypothetical protein JO339_17705 [Alphaproteobacteria bacterium]|nr:hypothetical protein [Alphaproteobacteria bacterium]